MSPSNSFTSVILIISLCFGIENALDFKDFLVGEEPLTTRRIVTEMIDYFKADDPHGIPILEIPEPLGVGGPLALTSMTLNNVSISGHSQLRLEHVDVDLEKLQVKFKVSVRRLEILADYEWPGYWTTSKGDMNVTFVDLHVGATASLGISDEGNIVATNFELIFDKELFIPTFTGLITQHYLLVSVADTFFDSFILPMVQQRAKDTGIEKINERLAKYTTEEKKFPVDISPVDFMIAKVKVDAKIDPYRVKDQEIPLPIPVSMVIRNTYVNGLSTLHRTQAIRCEFVDNRIYVKIELGTQKVTISTDWSMFTSFFPLGGGHAEFIVDSFEVSLEAQQEADIRHPPILRSIDLKLGNLALRSDGERNIDYLLEALINYLPNIFRNVIMDRKVEGTVKKAIQEKFNTIGWEQIIQEKLDNLNN